MPSDATEQQRAIFAAALELLADGGPKALRVRDIANAAGCTTMSVYSRFGGKDGLLDAIYVDGFRRFAAALSRETGGPTADRILRLGTAYRKWARANPGAYQVMFTEAVPGFTPSEAAGEIAIGAFEILRGAMEELQAGGELRAGDPAEVAWALWGMAHGLVMLELAGIRPAGGSMAIDEVYPEALAAFGRGFGS